MKILQDDLQHLQETRDELYRVCIALDALIKKKQEEIDRATPALRVIQGKGG